MTIVITRDDKVMAAQYVYGNLIMNPETKLYSGIEDYFIEAGATPTEADVMSTLEMVDTLWANNN